MFLKTEVHACLPTSTIIDITWESSNEEKESKKVISINEDICGFLAFLPAPYSWTFNVGSIN
jgi:hypothetical protein